VFEREKTMTDLQLTLSGAEYQFLVGLLEMTLNETRIEEHRTRKQSYREYVLEKEHMIEGLLQKLKRPASASRTPAAGGAGG
jgi:hypothetical protein